MNIVTRCTTAALIASSATAALAQFEDEPRLDAPVSHVSRARPVFETIEAISEKTGVKLSVAPDIREDLIVLRALEVPASELLKKIAEHFSWSWRKKGDGWELYRTREQISSEEAAVRKQILERYKDQQQRIKDMLDEVTKMSKEDLSKLVQLTRTDGEALLPRPLPEDSYRKYTLGTNPLDQIIAAAFIRLNDEQLWELYSRGRLALSTTPTNWQHNLRPDPRLLEESLRKRQEQQIRFISGIEARGDSQWLEAAKKLAFDNSEIAALLIVFVEDNRNVDRLSLSVQATWLLRNGESRLIQVSQYQLDELPTFQTTSTPTMEPRPLDDVKFRPEDAARIFWTTPDEFERRFVEPVTAFMKLGSKTHPLEALGRIWIDVAEVAKRNLICDAYDDDAKGVERIGATWRSIAEFIDAICSLSNRAWTDSNGWIEIRSNRWQLARHRSVPSTTLFSIRDSVLTTMGYTLDSVAKHTSQLNYEQAMSLLIYLAGLRIDSRTYFAARLWGELSPQMRATLRSGGSVPFRSLLPPAQEFYLASALRADTWISVASVDDEIEQAFITSARRLTGFMEEREPSVLPGDEVTQYLEFGIPATAMLQLYTLQSVSFQQSRGMYGNEFLTLSWVGWLLAQSDVNPTSPPQSVRIGSRELALLRLVITPGVSRAALIDTRWVDPTTEPVPISSLPEDLLARARKAYEARPKPLGGGSF